MSIASEISRISQNVADSLDAVAAKGVTVPTGSTSDDLPELIAQITSGGIVISDTTDAAGGIVRTITATNATTLVSKTVTTNGTYDPADDNADGYSEIIVNVSGGDGMTWETVFTGDVTTAGDDWPYAAITPWDETIVLGSVWRITWNGVPYLCTAVEELDTGGKGYCLGNCELDGGTTGNNEPFMLQVYSWGANDALVVASETVGTYDIIIEKQVPISGSTLVSKTITENGIYDPADDDADGYSEVTVSVPEPSLQAKTNILPTTSSQTITPDNGYDGLSSVQIDAMPSGTAGTPTATKGMVSNHSVSITPSVTNTTGYITGGTNTGTAVTVSASELVSGNKAITSAGNNIDVADYATASVASGTVTAPSTISGTSATVSTGTNTLTLTKTVSVTPSVTTAGFVSSGTAGNSSVSLTASVTTKAASTYNTSTTDQTIASGTYLTGAQTIRGVTVSGLDASKILSGTTVMIGDSADADRIASVSGSVTFSTITTSSSNPTGGSNGDIWIKTS